MKVSNKNEMVFYKGEDIINVLKEIEFILESLHYIGSYYADNIDENRQAYERETTNFIDNSQVCVRLAKIREKLSESLDLECGDDEMDDIERACCDINSWSKPGDCPNEFWLR